MLDRLSWLGHASFVIAGKKRLYIDPWKIKEGSPKADIIFITHEHYDHNSPDDITGLSTPNTVIVGPRDVVKGFKGNIVPLRPREKTDVEGVRVSTIRAYNVNKTFHPSVKDWLGYVIDTDGLIIYHAGDTDRIDEMKGLKGDVALLPIGGTYTMDANEAALAASDIRPGVAVPMHYGSIVGTDDDAQTFLRQCKVKAEVLVRQK